MDSFLKRSRDLEVNEEEKEQPKAKKTVVYVHLPIEIWMIIFEYYEWTKKWKDLKLRSICKTLYVETEMWIQMGLPTIIPAPGFPNAEMKSVFQSKVSEMIITSPFILAPQYDNFWKEYQFIEKWVVFIRDKEQTELPAKVSQKLYHAGCNHIGEHPGWICVHTMSVADSIKLGKCHYVRCINSNSRGNFAYWIEYFNGGSNYPYRQPIIDWFLWEDKSTMDTFEAICKQWY